MTTLHLRTLGNTKKTREYFEMNSDQNNKDKDPLGED